MNATLGPERERERESCETLHSTICIICDCKGCRCWLLHHGAAGVPREVVCMWGKGAEREGRPAKRERRLRAREREHFDSSCASSGTRGSVAIVMTVNDAPINIHPHMGQLACQERLCVWGGRGQREKAGWPAESERDSERDTYEHQVKR